MTPAQLAVERDALLQGGRTLEEAEAMQLLSDPEWVRLLRLWGDNDEAQPAYDHACRALASTPSAAVVAKAVGT